MYGKTLSRVVVKIITSFIWLVNQVRSFPYLLSHPYFFSFPLPPPFFPLSFKLFLLKRSLYILDLTHKDLFPAFNNNDKILIDTHHLTRDVL